MNVVRLLLCFVPESGLVVAVCVAKCISMCIVVRVGWIFGC